MASPHAQRLQQKQQQQQQQHQQTAVKQQVPQRASSLNLGTLSMDAQQDLFKQTLPAGMQPAMAKQTAEQATRSGSARSGESTHCEKSVS